MRSISFAWTSLFAATTALAFGAEAAGAAPALDFPSRRKEFRRRAGFHGVGDRRYRDYDDDYYEHVPPSYYAPRVYGYVQHYGYGPPPPAVYPPLYFYDWGPPPRPTSCGKFRYWNGEYCADARFRPPYLGPRW